MLYALGVGPRARSCSIGANFAFVYEKALKVLPTFPVVLGFDPFLLRDHDTGVTYDDGAWRGASHAAPATRDVGRDSSRGIASTT